MRFLSLHEAPVPTDGIASKYNVPTYEDYKAWASTEGRELFKQGKITTYPPSDKFSVKQSLAFSVVSCLAICNQKPAYLVINKAFVLQMVSELGTVLYTFEEIPLVVNAEALVTICWLL